MDGGLIHGSGDLEAANHAVIVGDLSVGDFLAAWQPVGAAAQWRPGRSSVTRLGMVAASAGRHLAAAGDLRTEAVWRALPGVERLLRDLSHPDDPPREVIASYVPGGSFLGTPAELAFKTASLQVERAYAEFQSLVGPLCDPAAWGRSDAAQRLTEARTPLLLARAVFIEQAQAPEEQRAEFRDLVRGFYRPLVIGGVHYEGINAAHVEVVATADVVLGTDDPAYRAYLADIRRHLLREDRLRLDRALAQPSLAGALAERLDVRGLDAVGAADALNAAPLLVQAATAAYAALTRVHATVSGAHWGVIQRVLREPVRAPAPNFVTPPAVGTGGRAHSHTRSLVEMRHQAARRAARLVDDAVRTRVVPERRVG